MNKDSKPLYQPWSEESFRSDTDVQVMNYLQRWMYRSLCQAAFVESTRPYLPDDDNLLWKYAGCENRKQWDRYKDEVRAAFINLEIGGVKLLSRKRVTDDWNRLQEKRAHLKELGARGGKSKAKRAEESKEGSEVKEDSKGSYYAKPAVSDSLAHANPALFDGQGDEDMAFNQNLEVLAARILKFTGGLNPKEKSELKLLSRAYSTDRIEQDFEAWAEENRGGNARYPFSLYLTKIKDRLESEPEPEIVDDGRVRYIAGKIYEMTGRLPVGPAQSALVKLLQKYETSDIIAAFSEYLSSLDAFETKWAVKNFFTEGGAEIVIEKRLKDLESNKRMEQQIEKEVSESAQAETIKNEQAAAEREKTKRFELENADQI